jgi:hypothetical protein
MNMELRRSVKTGKPDCLKVLRLLNKGRVYDASLADFAVISFGHLPRF